MTRHWARLGLTSSLVAILPALHQTIFPTWFLRSSPFLFSPKHSTLLSLSLLSQVNALTYYIQRPGNFTHIVLKVNNSFILHTLCKVWNYTACVNVHTISGKTFCGDFLWINIALASLLHNCISGPEKMSSVTFYNQFKQLIFSTSKIQVICTHFPLSISAVTDYYCSDLWFVDRSSW